MYQDFQFAGAHLKEEHRSVLYFEVASLASIRNKASHFVIVVPERTTDYGSLEVYIRDPAGNMIGFGEPNASAAQDR
jgi:hypothetical protein